MGSRTFEYERREVARHRIAERIATLVTLMQGRRYLPPLSAMAKQVGACPRTVRRDIEALELAGFPVPLWRHFERPE